MSVRIIICTILIAITTPCLASGVFLEKKQDAYQLNKSEQIQIQNEFVRKFGPLSNNIKPKSNNPWLNKKKKHATKPGVNWGVCRDYALNIRKQCYQAASPAFQCERFYEARVRLCDSQFDD